MTKAEYADYERRMTAARTWVSRFDPISDDDISTYPDTRCDICGRDSAGDRTECDWVAANGKRGNISADDTLQVCDDCIYYQEYGRLDDQTMMDMENEQ